MSHSTSKYNSSNRDIIGDSQTLYDFLKRKKKFNLQNTVNKSLVHHSYTKKKIDFDLEDDYPQQQSKTRNTFQYNSNKEVHKVVRQTITPKKIDFQESKQLKNNRETNVNRDPTPTKQTGNHQAKSFLALISPLKNRSNSALQDNRYQKQNQSFNNNKNNKKVDTFIKKKVTNCINSLKQKFTYYNGHLKSLKQKTHGLVIIFNPILNHLLQTQNPYNKQVGDLKNKLKSFQSLISSIDTDSSDIIQDFHRELQQHMKFQEGSIKKIYQSSKNQQIQQFKRQKQSIISKLQLDNKKISKQNQLLYRKLQKYQKKKEQIQQDVQERQINHIQTVQRLKQNYQKTIQDLKGQIVQLKGEVNQLGLEMKQKDKEIKDERNAKESIQTKTRKQIQQIIQVKDAYLLNEIMVLKSQFNADITKISQFSRIKQSQLIDQIHKKDQIINKIQFQKGCDKHIQSKIIQEANFIKKQNLQLKAKADCIITDMYRMNEELYQHWIALKDIKALATRLSSFNQYKKIYDDLLFNDHLFH